jgi:hypothetical protein
MDKNSGSATIPKIVKMNNFGEEERQNPNHLYK